MSNKVKTTLTLNKDVIKRAKELNINMSASAERGIIEYIHIIENLQREQSNFKKDNSKKPSNEGDVTPNTKYSRVGPPTSDMLNRRELMRLFAKNRTISFQASILSH